jgi:hypothetical protein
MCNEINLRFKLKTSIVVYAGYTWAISSFIYEFTVITKYKITTLFIILKVYKCPLLNVIIDQLQLCNRPCSDSVKRQ